MDLSLGIEFLGMPEYATELSGLYDNRLSESIAGSQNKRGSGLENMSQSYADIVLRLLRACRRLGRNS